MPETGGVTISESHPDLGFQGDNSGLNPERLDQPGPLLGCQRGDHEAHSVTAAEIAPERAPDRIAEPFTVAAAIQHLGHQPGVGHRADGDIAQGQAHLAALTCLVAVVQRGEHGKSAVSAGYEVPRGQHLVDRRRSRRVPVLRPGHQRITGSGVHCEVHRLAPVVPAHHPQGDHVRTPGLHGGVAEKAALRQVGDALADVRRQLHQQFAPFRGLQVKRDRFLGAVEVFPTERPPLGREHITVVVQSARRVIDPDHLGPHLRAI